jgi:hypothetical protein
LQELNSRNAWHLDIQEDKINGFPVQELHGFKGILATGHQLKEGNLPDIILHQVERQLLIVNNQASHHFQKIFRVAV